MKKLIFTFLVSGICFMALAQDSSSMHKNELGIDATNFIKQFLNFNQQQFSPNYIPTYYVTYRRYTNHGNLRVAVGADFNSYNIPTSYAGDVNTYKYSSNDINARVGWEWESRLSKHWQAYYGVDVKTSITYLRNDALYWNAGSASGVETKAQIFGLSPLIGIRYKVNKRLSFLTEVSYSVNTEKDNTTNYYTPLVGYSPTPSVTSTTNKLYSQFGPPVSLFLTFSL